MDNGKINYQRILLIAGALSLFIYYLFQWVQMISNPVLRTSLDFVAYYSAARIMQEQGAAQVYDFESLHGMENQVVGYELGDEQVLPYLHMPFLLPMLSIFVDENYTASFLRWVLFLVFIFVLGFYIFSKLFPGDMPPAARNRFVFGVVSFFPCFVSLLLGQNTAILFFGVALLCWGIASEKEWLAGLGLALVSLRPHILLLILPPVFILYRRVFWKFFFIGLVLAALSFFLLGIQGMQNFLHIMLLAAGGQGYGLNIESMMNVQGFLVRNLSFLGRDTIRIVGWVIYLAGIPGLCWLAIREKKLDVHVLGKMLLICIVIVPHLHFHDLALLLFPLLSVYLGNETSAIFNGLQKLLHPMILSFLFLFGLFQETFFPSLVILILFIFLFYKRKIS